ncbi:midasin-like protein [Actinidia rufa]|uniref:Midasin-like protein n=1 Tax=Actinidia rufa TaxID=165716 RepID=A0A7J0G025_9ERIC|nr:midasin-like protein [Actinidia rufa]
MFSFPQHKGTKVFHHHAEHRFTTDGVPPVRHISGHGWSSKAIGDEIKEAKILPNPGEREKRETKSGRWSNPGPSPSAKQAEIACFQSDSITTLSEFQASVTKADEAAPHESQTIIAKASFLVDGLNAPSQLICRRINPSCKGRINHTGTYPGMEVLNITLPPTGPDNTPSSLIKMSGILGPVLQKGNIRLLHEFDQPFTGEAKVKMISSLSFKQENTIADEPVVDLLRYVNMLDVAVANALPSGQNPLQQLVLIIADGRFHEKENLKRCVTDILSKMRMVAFLLMDSPQQSIMDLMAFLLLDSPQDIPREPNSHKPKSQIQKLTRHQNNQLKPS